MPPAAMTLKRIHREISDLQKEDMGSITLEPDNDNMFLFRGTIPGPQGSVYEGGVFKVEVALAQDYPFSAPKVLFKTRIYHMNISDHGNVCLDILKHNWSPALSLFKLMLSLSSLLTDPNPQDPLVPTIAQQYIRNRGLHDFTARQWTESYAEPPPPPAPKPVRNAYSSSSQRANAANGRNGKKRAAPESADASEAEPIVLSGDEGPSSSTRHPTRKRRKSNQGQGGDGEESDVVVLDSDDNPTSSGPSSVRRSNGEAEVIELDDD